MNLAQDRPLFGFLPFPAPTARGRAELRCRLLEVLAASVARDVPLAPVLAAAGRESRGFARRALFEVRELLEEGVRLSPALRSSRSLHFSEATIAAIEAAEGTPHLAAVLAEAARDGAYLDDRRSALWASMFHPLLTLAVVGAVSEWLLKPMRERVFQAGTYHDDDLLATASTVGRVSGGIALVLALEMVVVVILCRVPALTFGVGGALRALRQMIPGFRAPARLAGAARLFSALAATTRAGLPLHDALRDAAQAADCNALSRSALVAAERAESGAPLDSVAAALLVPPAVRVRFTLAATRAPDVFADGLREISANCAQRCRDVVAARLALVQAAVTLVVAALVFAQLFSMFMMIESVRRSALVAW